MVDVVIVGAGAAGSLYAARLAKAGKRVVVLEAGPAWKLDDLYSSQIWARRLKWSGPLLMQPPGQAVFSHTQSTGTGFGGAALHHFGTWPRLRPSDFRTHTVFGKGLDWPISYDDLRPYYDRIQTEMGIAGDARQEVWRPKGVPYPMPPHKLFNQAKLLARGFAKVGLKTAPLPVIINSKVYNGRAPCLYDGWCEAGCPIGAFANPLVTHLEAARQAGAEFREHCSVTRVLTGTDGRASGVEYVSQGKKETLEAHVVILATSMVQNPRLLLNSASDVHPQGLANSSGLVGAYLTTDAVAVIYGMFDEETENHKGVNAGQLLSRGDHVSKKRPDIFGPYQWQIAPSLKPNDLLGIATSRADLFGNELHSFMRKAAKHLASMAGFAGAIPDRDNRITLAKETDQHGMPLARLNYRAADNTRALWKYLIEEGRAVMKAAGAKDVWTGPMAGGHVIGGTIMGADTKSSVCDSYGRTHDAPNVVLAGSGLFPSGSGSSPTYTLYAVAERSVEHMIKHWGEYTR